MTTTPLDHFNKENVGVSSLAPLKLDYSLAKFLNKSQIKPACTPLDVGQPDESHCVALRIYPQKLENMKKLFDIKIGLSYDFPFTVGLPGSEGEDLKWRLRLFPNGVDKDCKGFMSLFLCLDEAPHSVQVTFSLTGSIGNSYSQKFEAGDMYGSIKWRSKTQLPFYTTKLTYSVSDQCLYGCQCTFRETCLKCNSNNLTQYNSGSYNCATCGVVSKCTHNFPITNAYGPQPYGGKIFLDFFVKISDESLIGAAGSKLTKDSETPNSVSSDQHFLLMTPNVILNLKQHSYYFYKEILTKESDVFAAMFDHDTKEKQTSTIDIGVEMDRAALEFILSYLLYSHKLKYDEEPLDWCAILTFANYYNMGNLKKLSGKHLLSTVTVDNSIDILISASNNNMDSLKDYCINYISNNLTEVKTSSGWKKLQDHPVLLLLLFDASFTQSHTGVSDVSFSTS